MRVIINFSSFNKLYEIFRLIYNKFLIKLYSIYRLKIYQIFIPCRNNK